MNLKAQKTGSNIAEIIVVVLILVVANWLGYNYFSRIDLTEKKLYTISRETKEVLARLDDPVTVKAFISSDLPPDFLTVRDDVLDKLEEYVVYSKGKFVLRVIDPSDDEEKRADAEQCGVPEVQVQVAKKDELSVGKAYFGLSMQFEDRVETIPVLGGQISTFLEYELTSRLLKLMQEKKPRVGLYVGPFVTDQQQAPQYTAIRQVLSGQEGFFELVDINPQADKVLPPDLDALIIMGAFGMSEGMKYSIDQFIMKGGKVLVGLDAMMQPGQQGNVMQAYPSLPSIEDQLEAYGVKFNKQLIADPECAMATFRTQFGSLGMNYLLWPRITPNGLSPKNGAVANLESIVMPWPCPLEPSDTLGDAPVHFDPLMNTSPDSFLLNSPFDLDPQQDFAFLSTTAETRQQYTVAALLSGTFSTAFPDGPPEPEKPAAEGDSETPVMTQEPAFNAADQVKESTGDARLAVFSSALVFSDNWLGMPGYENALMLMNLMEQMASGEELLGIRSAPVSQRPLRKLTEGQKSFYYWANMLGMPLITLLFGLLLWFLKSQRRNALKAKYGQAGEVNDG